MQYMNCFLSGGLILGATISGLFSGWFACKHKDIVNKNIQAATCISPGLNQDICVSCNEVISETVLPVLEHQFGEYRIVVAPGKNKHGVQVKVCSVCNKGEFSTLICSHESSLSEVVREPDCYNMGTREITCLDCSTVMYEDIDTIPHEKTASFITKDATCFSEGERADVCVLCGKFAASEAIPVSDHSYGDWIVVDYPTPVNPGSKHRICKLCGNKDSMGYNIEMEPNSLYVPGAGIHCDFAVAEFTQTAVDANDVIYTDHAYFEPDENNPFILGHNYGSLGSLHKIKVGQNIYVRVEDTLYIYRVINSEYAVEYRAVNQIGQTTGVNIWDTYGSAFSSDKAVYRLHVDGQDRWVNENDGRTLHMYTCYYGSDKPEWKSAHGRNGRWIVLATLIETIDMSNK